MKIFGLSRSRARAVALIESAPPVEAKAMNSVADSRGGWWPVIRESFAGAWQRNVTVDANLVLSFHAVFACITLIASDIAKLRIKLVEKDSNGIWSETSSAAFSPVLRKPNHYQNRIQFWESWFISKLTRGNTYVLKQRDARNVVVALYVLDPARVTPLVSSDGSVFYQLQTDNLSGLEGAVIAPASEIIHDRMNTLFHPLVGVSPLYAAGLAATLGLHIQNYSARLFRNNSRPGGILSADGRIDEADALRLKLAWEENFGGENAGRTAVVGNGLKFQPMVMNAEDAQLIEQLKWSAEVVCGVFHVPPYKINVGPAPLNNNVQALNVEYYSQCLQKLIEDAELCLDEGLGIGDGVGPGPILGTEFDVDNLLRMDSLGQAEVMTKLVAGSIYSPDEARATFSKKPVPGGSSPMAQHQYYSLEALAKRNRLPDPFASGPSAAPAPPAPAVPATPAPDPAQQAALAAESQRADRAERELADARAQRTAEAEARLAEVERKLAEAEMQRVAEVEARRVADAEAERVDAEARQAILAEFQATLAGQAEERRVVLEQVRQDSMAWQRAAEAALETARAEQAEAQRAADAEAETQQAALAELTAANWLDQASGYIELGLSGD